MPGTWSDDKHKKAADRCRSITTRERLKGTSVPSSCLKAKVRNHFASAKVVDQPPCNHIDLASRRATRELLALPPALGLGWRDETALTRDFILSGPSQGPGEGPPPAAAKPRARAAAAAEAAKRITFAGQTTPTWPRCTAPTRSRARSRSSHPRLCARSRPDPPHPNYSAAQPLHVSTARVAGAGLCRLLNSDGSTKFLGSGTGLASVF